MKSEAFHKFWKDFEFTADKGRIIRWFEIGFSVMAIKNGFKLDALCRYREIFSKVSDLKIPKKDIDRIIKCKFVNPTHFFWKVLMQDFHSPFIKRDLLTNNPAQIADISQWASIIESSSKYSLKLIQDYLNREKNIKNYIPS